MVVAKLGHLHDLQARLDAAAMSPADLADADVLADKKWAREKVTGRISLEHRACTPAMLDTPRRRLEHRARYGHWSTLPSDPAPFSSRPHPRDQLLHLAVVKRSTPAEPGPRAANSRPADHHGLEDCPRASLP